MGYGENLKKTLDENKMTVKELSRYTGISAATLYSIIKRDSPVRYDFALRISNVLDIPIDSICKDNPYSEGNTFPPLLSNDTSLLANSNKSSYIKSRTMPILKCFNYTEMPVVDELLSSFFALDDAGREEIFDMIKTIAKRHTDEKRAAKLKEI